MSHLFAKTGPVNFDFDKFKFKLYNKQRKQKSLVIGSVQRRSDSNIIIHKSTPTIFFLIFPSEVFHSRTLFNYLYLNKSLSIVDGLQLGRDSLNPQTLDRYCKCLLYPVHLPSHCCVWPEVTVWEDQDPTAAWSIIRTTPAACGRVVVVHSTQQWSAAQQHNSIVLSRSATNSSTAGWASVMWTSPPSSATRRPSPTTSGSRQTCARCLTMFRCCYYSFL